MSQTQTIRDRGWVVEIVTDDNAWPVSAAGVYLKTRVDGFAVFPTRDRARGYQQIMSCRTRIRRATVTLVVD